MNILSVSIKKIIYLFLLLIGFLVVLFCFSEKSRIDDDYEVSYVDIPINRNIYYKNQGIFDNLSVNMIIYDNDKILVRGFRFKTSVDVDVSKYQYYCIDKRIYASNPNQMNSMGVLGPIDSLQFARIKKSMSDSEVLTW